MACHLVRHRIFTVPKTHAVYQYNIFTMVLRHQSVGLLGLEIRPWRFGLVIVIGKDYNGNALVGICRD